MYANNHLNLLLIFKINIFLRMSCVINKRHEQHMRPYNPRPGAVSASERLRDNQLSSLTRVSIERFDLA